MYDAREMQQDARDYKEELLRHLGGAAPRARAQAGRVRPCGNIVGVGYGFRMAGRGGSVEELAVRVYVHTKFPLNRLSAAERVPAQVNGRDTDVIAVGDAQATGWGMSGGHPNAQAGTLGCVVKDQAGVRYILSNNHVMVDRNDGPLGLDIYSPGPGDGGTQADTIAKLSDFEPLDFRENGRNSMDAAIAQLIEPNARGDEIEGIGRVAEEPMAPSLFQSVRKHGRTTLHTLGVIVDVSVEMWVAYGSQWAWFEEQLGVTGLASDPQGFGQRGDSGSLVVDAGSKRPVGLMFGVSGAQSLVTPIEPILNRFRVSIA